MNGVSARLLREVAMVDEFVNYLDLSYIVDKRF